MPMLRIVFKSVVRRQVEAAAEPPDWQCVRRFSDEETHVRMHGRHVRIARMKDQRHSHRAKAAPGEFRTILRRRRRQAAAAHSSEERRVGKEWGRTCRSRWA